MKVKLTAIVMVFIILSTVVGRAQTDIFSLQQTLTNIDFLIKNKKPAEATCLAPLVSVLLGFISYEDQRATLKFLVYKATSASKLTKWSAIIGDNLGKSLELPYYTMVYLPDNSSASILKTVASKNGASTRTSVAKLWANKNVTVDRLAVFESMGPTDAVDWVDIVVKPAYVTHKPKAGVTYPTEASVTVYNLQYYLRQAELAKRSVPVKLIADKGMIDFPATFTVSYYPTSKATVKTNVSIPVGFPLWSAADVPKLQALQRNSFWADMATAKLVELGY